MNLLVIPQLQIPPQCRSVHLQCFKRQAASISAVGSTMGPRHQAGRTSMLGAHVLVVLHGHSFLFINHLESFPSEFSKLSCNSTCPHCRWPFPYEAMLVYLQLLRQICLCYGWLIVPYKPDCLLRMLLQMSCLSPWCGCFWIGSLPGSRPILS